MLDWASEAQLFHNDFAYFLKKKKKNQPLNQPKYLYTTSCLIITKYVKKDCASCFHSSQF